MPDAGTRRCHSGLASAIQVPEMVARWAATGDRLPKYERQATLQWCLCTTYSPEVLEAAVLGD